jgi:hypothetical protein
MADRASAEEQVGILKPPPCKKVEMIRRRRVWDVFAQSLFLMTSVVALFCCTCSAQVKVEVGLGAQNCRQVDVPGTPPFLWSVDPTTANKDSLDVAFQADDMNGPEFRTPSGNPSQLYFAAIPRPGLVTRIGPYSKEKYALGVHGAGPVREIGEQEWIAAEPRSRFRELFQPDYQIKDDDNENVYYKGKEFLKSGEHLSGGIVSLNARWIVVFSYDGKQLPPEQVHPGTIGIPGVSKHPRQGELYSDIYNVATGTKAIALKGAFQGQIANNWFLTAFFLEDRYFFLNTGGETDQIRQFWLCELPSSWDK